MAFAPPFFSDHTCIYFFCEIHTTRTKLANVVESLYSCCMATKTQSVAKATNTATAEETLVVIPPRVQKAVKALAQAHTLEKQIDAQVKSARQIVLDELDFGVTVIGTDAKGKRLVKVQVVSPTSPKYDTKAMLDFIATNHPEMLATFLLPPAEPTKKVLTL